MNDFLLGLKLAMCYINYGRCYAIRKKLMQRRVITVKHLAKINKLDKKLAELKVTMEELESLG